MYVHRKWASCGQKCFIWQSSDSRQLRCYINCRGCEKLEGKNLKKKKKKGKFKWIKKIDGQKQLDINPRFLLRRFGGFTRLIPSAISAQKRALVDHFAYYGVLEIKVERMGVRRVWIWHSLFPSSMERGACAIGAKGAK
ncbi:uncharacterized protein CIMG_11760 [Coccidioides immitis RS]|uniref:Uncharacterized protein n=2 Tax=Coccidioides immitis TaxID=5501 RepID=A0A0D8JTA4_COCIM|nr:uncharacterized protein CIMG_11760 [Coccidioides immitis RS]KJF60585.1 hypothetical protein CIMG_11760 [Coccidioides immitis RS]KMU83089.1 hypothetical protein CIHG_00871 [Coccidioides immitis H538.4]